MGIIESGAKILRHLSSYFHFLIIYLEILKALKEIVQKMYSKNLLPFWGPWKSCL